MYKFKTTLFFILLSVSITYGQTALKGKRTRIGKTKFFLTLPKSFKLIKKQGMDYHAFELLSETSAINGDIYIGNFPPQIVADPNCESEYINDTILNQKTTWLIDKCEGGYYGRVRIGLEEIEKMQFFVKTNSKRDLQVFISIIESLKLK